MQRVCSKYGCSKYGCRKRVVDMGGENVCGKNGYSKRMQEIVVNVCSKYGCSKHV